MMVFSEACGETMTAGYADPDASRAYLTGWKSRVDKMAAGTKAASDRLGEMRCTAEDDHRFLKVTIDAGVPVDVEFSQRVAPDAVSRPAPSVLRTARLGAAELSRQFITESPAARTITGQVERQPRGEQDDGHDG